MNERMAQDFDELAVASNRVEIFKKSLALYKLLKEYQRNGFQVIVRNIDKEEREIILF